MPCERSFWPLVLLLLSHASTCHAQSLNLKVASFLQGRLNQRIGGGDCAHAASEALRGAGAEFMQADLGADSPASGDYVWGSFLKQYSYTNRMVDSNSALKLVVGDVLQYHNAKFVTTTGTTTAVHHTSIVAAVNASGMPTLVYEQNFNNVRLLKKNTIDVTKLVAGYVRVYRPKARVVRPKQFKFSIVNNSPGAKNVVFKMNPGNQSIGSLRLDTANTVASYLRGTVNASSSTATFQLVLNNSVVNLVNGAGYEIYTAGGQTGIRRLTP